MFIERINMLVVFELEALAESTSICSVLRILPWVI